MRVAVLPILGASFLAVMASGCLSRATTGSLMRDTGNAFTAKGVLEAAHVLGHGCNDDEGSSARNLALCGSGGGSSPAANLATLGVGAARAAMGLALVAIADATHPEGRTKPLNNHALSGSPSSASALDRYEDPRQQSWLVEQSAACVDRATCPNSLDPRRVVTRLNDTDELRADQR